MTAKITGKRVYLPSVVIMEGERSVDKIEFSIQKMYGDIDLSSMTAYANIERADGTTDKIVLQTAVSGDELTVLWKIDESATAVAGELLSQISFATETGDVIFATEKFTLQVNSSIDAYTDLTDRGPNAFYRLQSRMYEYVNRMQELLLEVNDKIEELETGTGGAIIDEQHKVPANLVSGLAAVATSGSYNDLTNKPDLSGYCSQEQYESLLLMAQYILTPIYLKYVAMTDEASVISSVSAENKQKMLEYLDAGIFVRPIYLYEEAANAYYPVIGLINTDAQLTIQFKHGDSLYIAFLNKSNNTYGFMQ